MVEKLEATGQAVSTTGKQRAMNTPLYEVQGPSLGNGTFPLWIDIITSINLIYNIPLI